MDEELEDPMNGVTPVDVFGARLRSGMSPDEAESRPLEEDLLPDKVIDQAEGVYVDLARIVKQARVK